MVAVDASGGVVGNRVHMEESVEEGKEGDTVFIAHLKVYLYEVYYTVTCSCVARILINVRRLMGSPGEGVLVSHEK